MAGAAAGIDRWGRKTGEEAILGAMDMDML